VKASTSTIQKITLTEIDRLDPITVLIDDMAVGRGSITICCFGKAWTAYWGAMGDSRIVDFFLNSDVQYIAKNLSSAPFTEIDYGAISKAIDIDVDVTTLMMHVKEIQNVYGLDWHHCLPERPTSDYTYLCRIIEAVQEGLATDLQQQE
jgi:hypothetical protein